jgi:hypothetical protein
MMNLEEATDLEGIYGSEEAAKEMFTQLLMKEKCVDTEGGAKAFYFRAKNGIFYGKQKAARKKKYEELFGSIRYASK